MAKKYCAERELITQSGIIKQEDFCEIFKKFKDSKELEISECQRGWRLTDKEGTTGIGCISSNSGSKEVKIHLNLHKPVEKYEGIYNKLIKYIN